jgi:type II secretory pathway predicted ATPase ExeA
MYASYFGLRENPFNLTPDPRYLFLSTYHKEALDHLFYGINERKGFIAITGGIGTGKTTICRALLSHLDSSAKSALIFNSCISDTELLEIINQEFGIDLSGAIGTKREYIDKLNQFLLETFSRGGNAVLLIDEAQNLSHTVLEQIRMLSNLETDREKLMQIILVGQSELRELLSSSSLRQLNERIMVRYELKSLNRNDVQGYVEHRLVVAGSKGTVRFTNSAIKAIYRSSQGNPRRINAICDRALLAAYARDEFTISKGTVRKAIEDIEGNAAHESPLRNWSRKRIKLSTAVMLVFIALGCLFAWNYRSRIVSIFSPPEGGSVPLPEYKERISLPIPPRQTASLVLDEQVSLAALFRLFKENTEENSYTSNIHIGLFSFVTKPASYLLFKKPFRVLLVHPEYSQYLAHSRAGPATNPAASSRYLLIRKVTADGAVAVDAQGKDRRVTGDFLETHWGQEVSWVYLYRNKDVDLVEGMRGSAVSKAQRILKEIGYSIEVTGIYDHSTVLAVVKFQKDLGLMADGIVGQRTKALLYQMSG